MEGRYDMGRDTLVKEFKGRHDHKDYIKRGIRTENLFIDEAINLGITGVGSYFQSNSGREFFHLDVGPKRHWGPDTSYLSQYAFMLPILRKYSFPSTSIAGKTTTTKKTLSRA